MPNIRRPYISGAFTRWCKYWEQNKIGNTTAPMSGQRTFRAHSVSPRVPISLGSRRSSGVGSEPAFRFAPDVGRYLGAASRKKVMPSPAVSARRSAPARRGRRLPQ